MGRQIIVAALFFGGVYLLHGWWAHHWEQRAEVRRMKAMAATCEQYPSCKVMGERALHMRSSR